jgi:hypothetical protein
MYIYDYNMERSSLIPICSFCNKIRTDEIWEMDIKHPDYTVHEYTHGCCPECIKEHYPAYAEAILKRI